MTSLLALSGASLNPSPLERSTLMIIDAQMEYVTGKLPLAGIAPALAEIAVLLDLARKHGVPVIHVAHHAAPGRPLFDPAGAYAAIAPEALPAEGEPVVIKSLPNSFAGTDLAARLKETGRPELVLAGFMTHNCLYATAMAALDHGYRSTIVAAATATRDLGEVPAEIVQRAALAGLADRAAILVRDHSALWQTNSIR
jgi:nicotinamidase-related amidase